MGVSRIYRKEDERANASYNYTDLADGTGVTVFYAAGTKNTTADYILTQSVAQTGLGSTEKQDTGTDYLDFDLTPFNLPRTAKGTALVNATISVVDSGTGGGSVSAELYHWDGASETSISTTTTSSVTTSTTTLTTLMELDITQKTFKQGDILRLKIGIINSNGADINVTLQHDPEGANPLILYMPFRLDI